MRTALVLGLLVFGVNGAWALPGFPDGVFGGEGTMREGAGNDEIYQARLTIKGMTLSAHYVYPDGHPVSYEAELKATKDGEFDVIVGGNAIGEAYCQNAMCHLTVPAHKAEETLVYRNNEIYRVGSMVHPKALLMYSETLKPKKVQP